MPNNYMSLTFETDMSRGISPVTIKAALVYDDNLAHNVRIKCMEKGRFQSMSGTVQAYFIRADNSTVPMNGQIVDGVPEVKLLPECYNIAGRFLFLVKITNSGSTNTIFYGTGNVLRGRTDVVIDPGEVVPSLDELLAKINELELATNASFEATERANSAAETANTAAAAADEVRQDIQSGLAGKAPAIFLTASGDLVHITDGAAMPVKSLITHIEPVQSGSGDPSPSNVRPISGWTGANLTRTGENDPNGTQFTAQFGQTVYGGEFNWKTGVLLSNKALIDLGDYEWVRDSNDPVFRTAAYLQDIFVNTTVISTHYTSYGLDLVDVIDNNNSVCVIGGYIWLRDDRYTDPTALQTALDGVMMLAELVTPEEIQLTPQQILSLAGENNLWSDAGETEVTYAADTKMYIDQKIAAIAAAVLNN